MLRTVQYNQFYIEKWRENFKSINNGIMKSCGIICYNYKKKCRMCICSGILSQYRFLCVDCYFCLLCIFHCQQNIINGIMESFCLYNKLNINKYRMCISSGIDCSTLLQCHHYCSEKVGLWDGCPFLRGTNLVKFY